MTGTRPNGARTSAGTSLRLVVNPAAGVGRARRALPPVRAALVAGGWDVDVSIVTSLGDATELSAGLPRGRVVAALGGDGLVAAAAAGVRRSGAVLAPLPGGRGNDYCRALGVPSDPVRAAEALAFAVPRRVDVAEAGDRIVVGVAGAGFDASVIAAAARMGRWSGRHAYALAAVRVIRTAQPRWFEVEVDDESRADRAWLVAVGVTDRFGGGLRICPTARIDDGALDVVTIGAIPRHQFVPMLVRVLSGSHVTHPEVTVRRGAHVRVAAVDPTVMYADGEPIGSLPLELVIRPAALTVLGGRSESTTVGDRRSGAGE